MRTILIAPDSFKGTLSADEAADAMALGVTDFFPGINVLKIPLSDGGEGVVDVLTRALGGTLEYSSVQGPLPGQQVSARWGRTLDGRTAVIEMAQAAGLSLVPPARRDPGITTTYGVGELLRAALDHGARKIIIGIGGSATNDAGSGMADALGIRLLDDHGQPIPWGGIGLSRLRSIDMTGRDPRLPDTDIVVACDVRNPLVGPSGASAVYGPQKGASPEQVGVLDMALGNFREIVRRSMGVDVQTIPGSGAAGGLGAGLVAFCGGHLKPGIDIVLDALQFDSLLDGVDLVLTGEGKMDPQTRQGKVIAGVMQRCARRGTPLAAIVGRVEEPEGGSLRMGFAGFETLVGQGVSVDDAMRNAAALLRVRTTDLLKKMTAVTHTSPQAPSHF